MTKKYPLTYGPDDEKTVIGTAEVTEEGTANIEITNPAIVAALRAEQTAHLSVGMDMMPDAFTLKRSEYTVDDGEVVGEVKLKPSNVFQEKPDIRPGRGSHRRPK